MKKKSSKKFVEKHQQQNDRNPNNVLFVYVIPHLLEYKSSLILIKFGVKVIYFEDEQDRSSGFGDMVKEVVELQSLKDFLRTYRAIRETKLLGLISEFCGKEGPCLESKIILTSIIFLGVERKVRKKFNRFADRERYTCTDVFLFIPILKFKLYRCCE